MRVSYRDEVPWSRCDCGWLVSGSGECPGCKKTETPDLRERFSRVSTVDTRGNVYRPVPFEDSFRRA